MLCNDQLLKVMLVGQDANFLSALVVPSLDGLFQAGAIDQSDMREIADLKENGDEEVRISFHLAVGCHKARL